MKRYLIISLITTMVLVFSSTCLAEEKNSILPSLELKGSNLLDPSRFNMYQSYSFSYFSSSNRSGTFGLYTIIGQKLNMISMTLPTILMVYTLADVVHIMNIYFQNADIYQQKDKRELIRMTLSYCLKPCFFAK